MPNSNTPKQQRGRTLRDHTKHTAELSDEALFNDCRFLHCRTIPEPNSNAPGQLDLGEALFKQPPPKEDCQICFLPMPHSDRQSYMACCGKGICDGCIYADSKASSNEPTCPFCRELVAKDEEEAIQRIKSRVTVNDAQAAHQLGCHYYNGAMGLPQDMTKAVELWFQAAELGSNDAHCALGLSYCAGEGVEIDMKKSNYHFEIAAMAGSEEARHNLGIFEAEIGNMNRAIKHWMIAATAGNYSSMKEIKEALGLGYGHVTKDEYEKTLRGFIVSVKEMRSEDRDIAALKRL